jgi:hypothetical protein
MTEAYSSHRSGRTLVYEQGSGWLIQWTAEIDPAMRRLRLSRQWFGRWTKTAVDCSLDDCISVGTIEYDNDGHITYGTYFKLRNGNWHAIPIRGNSFEAALQVVKEISAATRIPRLDVKYS